MSIKIPEDLLHEQRQAQHLGYILDTIERVYDTYEEALHGLKETLESSIEYVKETTVDEKEERFEENFLDE